MTARPQARYAAPVQSRSPPEADGIAPTMPQPGPRGRRRRGRGEAARRDDELRWPPSGAATAATRGQEAMSAEPGIEAAIHREEPRVRFRPADPGAPPTSREGGGTGTSAPDHPAGRCYDVATPRPRWREVRWSRREPSRAAPVHRGARAAVRRRHRPDDRRARGEPEGDPIARSARRDLAADHRSDHGPGGR